VHTPEPPPGPTAPGMAQTLSWMYRPIPFIERCRRRYGPIFTLGLGPQKNAIVIADPGLAKAVMTGNPDVFRAGDANGIVRPVVGPSSLLVLDGDQHSRHRRIMLPAFGARHGSAFAEQVREIAAARIAGWSAGQTLRLQDEMEAISFEAILTVVFGDQDERRERFRELVPDMMRRCASPFTLLPYFRKELGGITPYARLRRVLDELDELFYAEIADRRAQGPQPDGGVLSLLVSATDEEGDPLPDEQVRDELLTLIMAGYETTTSALAWSFERLLRTPAVLDRLLRERDVAYLDAVVKESLRIRPVVPVVARKIREPVQLGHHVAPEGSVLMVSVYLLHSDPELYPDPEEFRPERFLGDEPDGSVWVPFGGGTRRCLGARFAEVEMKVVLRTVFERVRLSAPDAKSEPVARRRFTFAPGRGSRAVVDEVRGGG
jgi:cytochrome P450